MKELKPCPFCGAKVEMKEDIVDGFPSWSIEHYCDNKKGTHIEILMTDTNPADLTRAWNIRALI